MYIGLHVEYSFRFLTKLECSLKIFEKKKITHVSNFMKIRPVGVEVFHADGWTGVTKLTVVFFFPQFCERA